MARSDLDVYSKYEIGLDSISDSYTEDSGLIFLSVIVGQKKKCISTFNQIYFAPESYF